jgi:serine/threonine protein phosphatase PrpC
MHQMTSHDALFEVAQATSIGGREVNQDAFSIVPIGNAYFLVVADGLGGHAAGEVASRALSDAAASAASVYTDGDFDRDPEATLQQVFQHAAARLQEHLQLQPEAAAAKTTCVLVWCSTRSLATLHVGDTRVYILRENESRSWRTRDHSVAELADPADGADRGENQSRLYRSLGQGAIPAPSVHSSDPLADGELVVLCSDGIWNAVALDDILDLRFEHDLASATGWLIERAAIFAGSDADNATVLAIRRGRPHAADPDKALAHRLPAMPAGTVVGPFEQSQELWTIKGLLRARASENTDLAANVDGEQAWVVECCPPDLGNYYAALRAPPIRVRREQRQPRQLGGAACTLVQGMALPSLVLSKNAPSFPQVSATLLRWLVSYQSLFRSHGRVSLRNVAVDADENAVLWHGMSPVGRTISETDLREDAVAALDALRQLGESVTTPSHDDQQMAAGVAHWAQAAGSSGHWHTKRLQELTQDWQPVTPKVHPPRMAWRRWVAGASVATFVTIGTFFALFLNHTSPGPAVESSRMPDVPTPLQLPAKPQHVVPESGIVLVRFEILPSNSRARVYLDNQELAGSTAELLPGTYSYVVSAPGYQERSGRIVVKQGVREVVIPLDLTPVVGSAASTRSATPGEEMGPAKSGRWALPDDSGYEPDGQTSDPQESSILEPTSIVAETTGRWIELSASNRRAAQEQAEHAAAEACPDGLPIVRDLRRVKSQAVSDHTTTPELLTIWQVRLDCGDRIGPEVMIGPLDQEVIFDSPTKPPVTEAEKVNEQ